MPETATPPVVVLVPVKAFDRAKGRLAAVLGGEARASLARAMAEVVVTAAHPLDVVVVCDDAVVAAWARGREAAVAWTPDLDLNAALTAAVERAAAAGVTRVVIAHADLPYATELARFAAVPGDAVVMVPDRHGKGTNVMSLPTDPLMELHYGPGSFRAHRAAADAAGLAVEVVADEALGWDVDDPADLAPPGHLGALPGLAGLRP